MPDFVLEAPDDVIILLFKGVLGLLLPCELRASGLEPVLLLLEQAPQVLQLLLRLLVLHLTLTAGILSFSVSSRRMLRHLLVADHAVEIGQS